MRGLIFGAFAMLMLGACSGRDDSFPDYRYRMTVEVETPEGVKTGSSVIEVRTEGVSTIQASSGKSYRSQFRGEAVVVDVAPGKPLFALLGKPNDPDYAKRVAFAALKPVRTTGGDLEGYRQHLSQMVEVEGAHELPRGKWPFMVTFSNIDDPTSVREVSPASASAAFGDGVRIKRVTIQITDDEVTTGIRKRFKWWDAYLERHFDGTSTISQDLTDPGLLGRLSSGSFSTEFRR